MGTNILAVKSDHDGMIPESLEEILSQWSPDDANDPDSDIPKGTRNIEWSYPCYIIIENIYNSRHS